MSARAPAAEQRERLGREDHLDRDGKISGDPQREVEARRVLTPLQITHGLVVHPQGVRELAPGHSAFGSQHGDAVVNLFGHVAQYPLRITRSRAAATWGPDWRRAITPRAFGASNRPATDHTPRTSTI